MCRKLFNYYVHGNLQLNFFFANLPSLSEYRKLLTVSALNRAVYCIRKKGKSTDATTEEADNKSNQIIGVNNNNAPEQQQRNTLNCCGHYNLQH